MLAQIDRPEPVVHVVDDDDSFRHSMLRLLALSGYRAAGYRCAGALLLTGALEHPGCVLLDITMPDLNGMDVLKALRARRSMQPVVMLTGLDDVKTCVDAIRAGAVDYLVKPIGVDKVLECVTRCLRIDAEARALHEEKTALRRRLEQLNATERRILLGMASSKLNKQLAFELGACERTIKAHRARIRSKLRLTSAADLVRASRALEQLLAQSSPGSPFAF